MMKTRLITSAILLFFCATLFPQKGVLKKTMKADMQYLLYPVNNQTNRERLEFKTKDLETYFDIRIAADKDSVDYWAFMDISRFAGQKITISAGESDYLQKAFELIVLGDRIITEIPIYSEELRQQVHFSSRRGWNNDPNGLVYCDGEYHLFYQHNPYGWNWGNMHWGHAVSSDLIHWKELPDALHPDELGTMFSGSAVIDKNNTSGWGIDALVAAYTANKAGGGQSQNMAYSNDRGRTFTKYQYNPVLPAVERFGSRHERDPKVFWYEPNNNWVMVLFESTGLSIFTSGDLKKWNYESHVEGFWECPELFELAVDGNVNQKKWIMYGASGRYKIGSFDGRKFTPETTKSSYIGGGMYAAQTYNNTPDGRRIQIGWGTIPSKGMPFNQMMSFPTEMQLKTGADGLRMHIAPIEEISLLYKKSYSYTDLVIGQKDINEIIQPPRSRLLHIKAEFLPVGTNPFTIVINGHKITYNSESDSENETYLPQIISKLKLEFIVDINSIEVFINDGQLIKIIPHNSAANEPELSFEGKSQTMIELLEIHELKSIWGTGEGVKR